MIFVSKEIKRRVSSSLTQNHRIQRNGDVLLRRDVESWKGEWRGGGEAVNSWGAGVQGITNPRLRALVPAGVSDISHQRVKWMCFHLKMFRNPRKET